MFAHFEFNSSFSDVAKQYTETTQTCKNINDKITPSQRLK